jgi:two-component system chemotaxis response regulator CheB
MARAPVDMVCIGASAGGVEALMSLLGPLPANYRLPLVVVVHLPEDHESVLTEVLQHHVAFPMQEACDKESIGHRGVYIAPPGYHLQVEDDRTFSLSCDPPVNYSRPSIDLMFSSASHAFGPSLAGVLLTGANEDGAEGLATIARAGGITAVQDPATARVTTMPESALRIYPQHTVLSLDQIHQFLLKLEKDAHA